MFPFTPPFSPEALKRMRKSHLLDANGDKIESGQEEPSLEESLKMSRQNIFDAKQRKIIEELQQNILDKIEAGKIDVSEMLELSGALRTHVSVIQDSYEIYRE